MFISITTRCGGEVGIYIVVRKGITVLLCEDAKGTFVNLPYLDAHGEVDVSLKYVNDYSAARQLLMMSMFGDIIVESR